MHIKLKYVSILAAGIVLALSSCKKEDTVPFYAGTPVLISNFDSIPTATQWPRDWQGPKLGYAPKSPDSSASFIILEGSVWQTNPQTGVVNNPYVTSFSIPAAWYDGAKTTNLHYPNYVDPNMVYFNAYVYNPGKDTNPNNIGWLIISFTETLQDGQAKYSKSITIKYPNWVGWKLISLKYSDIPASDQYGNPTVAVGKPNLIESVNFVLLSTQGNLAQTPEPTVTMYIDKPIFTFNQPYQETAAQQ